MCTRRATSADPEPPLKMHASLGWRVQGRPGQPNVLLWVAGTPRPTAAIALPGWPIERILASPGFRRAIQAFASAGSRQPLDSTARDPISPDLAGDAFSPDIDCRSRSPQEPRDADRAFHSRSAPKQRPDREGADSRPRPPGRARRKRGSPGCPRHPGAARLSRPRRAGHGGRGRDRREGAAGHRPRRARASRSTRTGFARRSRASISSRCPRPRPPPARPRKPPPRRRRPGSRRTRRCRSSAGAAS